MSKLFDVIISGAGPAGLTLAIDLGQRGVRVLLLERNHEPGPWPKMERTNSRSMEFYRRLGLADEIRAQGYPADASMDVFTAVDLATPIARISYPTVAEQREWIAATRDGSAPLEPYQLVSQYALEPVLKAAADALPSVQVCFAHELTQFVQDEDGVNVSVRTAEGEEKQFCGKFLVGCDGGSSPIRKPLGIPLQGQGGILRMSQVQFRSETLYERIPIGKGRHYYLADGAIVVVQGNRRDFTLHTAFPAGTDFEPVIRSHIPVEFDLEVLRVNEWTLHLLVAERYRQDRVFLAGDAVHLVIPTGGLGMNTAVGDVMDLGWKLAAVIEGWGGQSLLDSYEIERRAVGLVNREPSGWAAQGPKEWRSAVTPEILEKTEAGDAARRAFSAYSESCQRRVHDMIAAEMAYHYAHSPIVMREADSPPTWDLTRYVPTAMPGARLPHMWLSDGRALFDQLGKGYSLICLAGEADTRGLVDAFTQLNAPLDVLTMVEPNLERVYGARLLLLRPDLHVIWRGAELPADVRTLANVATGNAVRG